MNNQFLTSILILLSSLQFALGADFNYSELPVQEAGRIKPLATVAQESLQLIHGKSKYKGQPALKIFTTWMMVPDIWAETEMVKIDHHGLKKALGFEKTKKYFSVNQVMGNPRLNVLFADVATRLERKEKLDPYYQAIQRLESQVLSFHSIRLGAIKIFPPKKEDQNQSWLSIKDMSAEQRDLFFQVMKNYTSSFTMQDAAEKDQAKRDLAKSLKNFVSAAQSQNSELYPDSRDMKIEVHYLKLQPFLWTWVLYLLGGILISLSLLFVPRFFNGAGLLLALLGFLMHSYGFALRSYITGRPPVTNMYETVVWVGWGAILFAGVLYLIRKRKFIIIAGTVVGTLSMIVADMAPVILDPSLQPLEPVLRSNMWLIIHVMTITLSYAAFFLAFALGDYGIFLSLWNEKKYKPQIRELSQATYRTLQIGVILLAAGTILGGVWADYSWGRFWGWDPKETWAFIALMGYLALLHARLVGWVKEFGMFVGSVITFNLVIMAWYGVNFVLGAGLHSYGFGGGGVEYVSAFCGLQLLYVSYGWVAKTYLGK